MLTIDEEKKEIMSDQDDEESIVKKLVRLNLKPTTPPKDLSTNQQKVYYFINNIYIRILTALMIIVDIVLVIVALSIPGDAPQQTAISLTSFFFSIWFVVEICLRIYGKGAGWFFSKWLNIIDFTVVMVTFIVSIIDISIESGYNSVINHVAFNPKLLTLLRILRILKISRIFKIITERINILRAAHYTTSENKQRYIKGGFDLDLCYVTPHIIAMGFPSTGLTALYRNNIRDVAKFFSRVHPEKFHIYNMCQEKDYDTTLFDERVTRFLVPDHNPPTMGDLQKFCLEAAGQIRAGETIAVHCKGGKGRTGTAICSLLLHMDEFSSADEALSHFASKRTNEVVGSKIQGVQTPSQCRYVNYYSELHSEHVGVLPKAKNLKITQLHVQGLLKMARGVETNLEVHIFEKGELKFWLSVGSGFNCESEIEERADILKIKIPQCPLLREDVRVMFKTPRLPAAYSQSAFYFWFHTSFLRGNSIFLNRDMLDNPHHNHKLYPEVFAVEAFFSVES